MTPTDRELKAIMFSDVKSFSAMMSQNEERTMRLIKEHREIVREILARHGGEEHGTAGDSFFVLFSSAVKAVQCAVEIQEAFHKRNADKPAEEQIWIRIGIHIGDIIVDRSDGHVYGEGINVAARTEPQAEPGGICITQDVFQQVQRKIDLKVISIGRKEMKNIVDAPELFKIIVGQVGEGHARAPAPIAEAAAAVPARGSGRRGKLIAVAVVVALVALAAGAFLFLRGEQKSAPPPSPAVAAKAAKTAADAGVPSVAAAVKPAAASKKLIQSRFPGKALVGRIKAPAEFEGLSLALASFVTSDLGEHFEQGALTQAEAAGLGAGPAGRDEKGERPIDVARRVGAPLLVLGEIAPVKGGVWLSFAFYDVSDERVTNRLSERAPDDPEQATKVLGEALDTVLTIPSECAEETSLCKERIRAIIHSRLGFVKYCYEKQLAKNPKLTGRIQIKFTIDKDGVFRDVHVADEPGTLQNAALSACIADVYDDLETGFPVQGQGEVRVTYPFELLPPD